MDQYISVVFDLLVVILTALSIMLFGMGLADGDEDGKCVKNGLISIFGLVYIIARLVV